MCDNSVKLLDFAVLLCLQGEERLRIPAHSGPITTLFVSPDGAYVATGGEDRRVIVWTTKRTDNANSAAQ